MNILFYTRSRVVPTSGGTERATATLATILKKNYRCKIISIYGVTSIGNKENCFDFEYNWDSDKKECKYIRDLITAHNINVIIVQSDFSVLMSLKRAINKLDCKLLFVHHFRPRWELQYYNWESVIQNLSDNQIPLYSRLYKMLLYPIQKLRYNRRVYRSYREAYDLSDKVILLIKDYILEYSQFSKIPNIEKFGIIPNALSFDETYSLDNIYGKKKIILIVARLNEASKKISVALDIWAEVSKAQVAKDWKLVIVGEGDDLPKYQMQIRNKRISNVVFEGRRDPVPYYKDASIFWMTSKSEAWGLTLTEAQQFGVVPMAFDNFPSAKVIIQDNVNGFLIPNMQIDIFVKKSIYLMAHDVERAKLAKGALLCSRHFSKEIIAKQWWNLLSNL